jgi:hypothetical protein
VMLNRNFKRVNDEVKAMINELLGKAPEEWFFVILRCFVDCMPLGRGIDWNNGQ